MKRRLHLALLLLLAVVAQVTYAQAPVATPKEAVTALLNRIGGNGAADKFVIVIDASLAENGQDVFVITSQDGKPCIKGNTQLSVTTGINWYLNHHAHINLTWNQLTTNLSKATLPVPSGEEKHVCNATYRYNFNTCTFSYSMAFWTWERWQQEIDWMALHGINAPLNLVGLDVVTRKFLRELGVSENDINAYIAGPGFIAWFAMNNLEGWGGTINSPSTGVNMSGNPDWWYTRQELLCRNMLQRMRELGMQPVIPGFSGQVPNCIVNYSINGFSSGDVVNNGTWAGGYTRPDILKPNTESYRTFAKVYYKHLHEVMGVSELYSIDPFHEGSLPSGVTNATCYPNIMAELDNYYNGVSTDDKTKFFVDEQPKWMIQYWQGVPQEGAFSAMNSYGDRFIALDLFADNIYADNAAKWRTNYYNGRPYIYCMLHNFGGRSGLHGRLETTLDGYFQAMAKGNNCQGIGATPEGTETNPILYDMLFELPWMNSKPTADEWLEDYAHARYGTENEQTLEAMKLLKKSVWDCKVNQQGTSEAIILARPNWTVNSVSSWSTSAIYWDTQDVLMAADLLISAEEVIRSIEGKENYNYDVMDVIRQAMVDYAAELLPLINAARGNNDEYTRLYQLYLQLMLDLDEMLSYNENFKLERWTSLARNIADEVSGTTENDRNWLEWNARTQITVWSKGNTDLHDYSNRCWAGLIKDFHYKRWEKFFTTKGGSFDGGWYSGFEYPWTVDFNGTYNLASDYSQVVIPTDMTATEKAAQTFGNYFGRVKGATKNYIFPMGVATKATKSDVIPEVYRGQTVDLPLIIGKNVTISSVWVDLNNDGAKGNGETLTANNNQVAIPADAAIGKTTAQVVYSDGTDITFNLALVEDITTARTVTAVAGANGSVAIEGTNELSVTNTKAVKMTATANTGYNFENWTDANGNVVSNDNPFIYYGKEEATFTANFIQDKWGVPSMTSEGLKAVKDNNQYVSQINFAYRGREAETIYDATSTAPTSLFTTIPQIINVPQGASFTISWTDNGKQNLTKCFLSAYMDFDGDGNFEEEGELVKVVGTRNADNASVRNGSFQVILPYDAPTGITHLRMRFDSAWGNQYNSTTKAFNSKGELDRMCYEVVINVTEKSDKAATVNVETNNAEWGSVEVWTDETPDGSTGTEWVVSANIPMYLRATKASEDVEFLGWYDHYGRLLTDELEYTMYAREDATYTAKFRKFLEIDGWNIEYRTESGSEVVTAKLAQGEKPVNGKKYYIAADAKQSNGSFISYYLYDNGSALKTTTSVNGNNYLWTCIINDDGTYSFQNESGKYLANDGNYYLSIGSTPAKYAFETANAGTGVALTNVSDGYTGSKWMVTKFDGSAFNKNSVSVNNGSWCNDYIFTEVSTPDVVVFTNVRKSGDHDLVIPETVEILGEQCKIVGFDNGVFNNNKDLWSITMPKSMEFLSEKTLFSHTLTGNDNASTQTFNVDIKNNEAWTITMDVKRTGELTGWGSCLLASGSIPAKSDGLNYAEGFQFYLQSPNNPNNKKENDKLIIKTKTQVNDNWYFDDVYQEASFKVIISYNGAQQLSVNVLKADGTNATNHNGTKEAIVFTDCTIQDIKQLCTNVQAAITAKVDINKTAEANPFSGCSNLDNIAIDGDCANYYVNDENGDLYNSSNVLVCSPEGRAKGAASRELAALIEKMKSLTAQVATYNPIGKENKIALQTTKGQSYYMWCNAPQSGDEGNISNLLDSNGGTFFHSNWGSTTAPADGLDHHFTIELGDDNAITNFKFYYKARSGSGLGDYPKTIKVQGSNDGSNYFEIQIVEPRNANGGIIENGAEWTSAVLTDGVVYKYLRFMVTATTTNKKKDGHIYFHMADFELYNMTSSATLHKHFVGTALTAGFAAEKYDVLLDAIYAFDHATTAEEVQNALNELQTAYTELENKIKEIISVKFTLDENNPVLHKIFIKRTEDVTVLKYDESDKMVAVADKADDSSWQAWYFMGDANGITIHPYNADGMVLSADNTSNAPAKVWAAKKGEKPFYGWLFVPQSDGYYNIQAHDKSNYFSNNGGVNNKMGFWSDDATTDGGSLFKIEEVKFSNDNPRFYQLSDFKATTTVDGTNIYGGTSVGLYTGGKEYREAYTTAMSLINAGNTSESDACYETYKNLRTAKEGLSYNEADPTEFYVIKSTATNGYCKGQYVHTYYELQPSHNNYDHKDLVYHNYNDIATKALAVFQFETTATQGEYKMKNLHTGLYVKSFGKNADHLGSADEAQVVKIAGIADGQVTLKIGDADPMHAQDDNDCIVGWGAAVGNASTWTIEEANVEDICHKVTISPVGYSTLYLNYPVAIPSGLSAYTTTQIGETTMRLTEISEVIPARTAVILQGEEGTYDFCYTETEEQTNPNALLKGTLYKETIKKDNGFNYYVLANVDTTPDDGVDNKKVGFYQAVKGDDPDKFINAANKAYLQVSPSEHGISLAFLGFDFDDDQETGIIETENGNVDGENAVIIDLQGRRLQKANKPGIYIVNGKKVLVK
ncbi:MAG: alpha-N-acetylglucosaminidase C-terminal domain-containing protein [Bacteroidaceae bacterium]|nr:alpha-N-acetylglucosaminidase C-terminal domain-containing protein [Bacteroidaceae bacterium]